LTACATQEKIAKMSSAATSSARVLRAIVDALLGEGVDVKAFLAELAIAPEVVFDDDARIPFLLLERAWSLVPDWSRDRDFGLHLAENAVMGAFDVLDYVARACANLGEAFDRLGRFQRLLHDVVTVTIEPHDDAFWIVHRVADDPRGVPRHAAEAAVASWSVRARSLSGSDVRPLVVRFQHARPSELAEHERIFRCAIEFSCNANVVVFPKETFARPIVTADRGLRATLDRHAQLLLERLPSQGFIPQARAALVEAMRGGSPHLARVATRLGTSTRSLQRRLAEHGVRFETMVDDLRRELAFRYLAEPNMPLAEIAFLLGYSDHSAFHRAFRRWAECTPQEYRRRLSSGEGSRGPRDRLARPKGAP
jgi:AraC-like DNA-binding protein